MSLLVGQKTLVEESEMFLRLHHSTMVLHSHRLIVSGGWTIGPLVAAVQRHSLIFGIISNVITYAVRKALLSFIYCTKGKILAAVCILMTLPDHVNILFIVFTSRPYIECFKEFYNITETITLMNNSNTRQASTQTWRFEWITFLVIWYAFIIMSESRIHFLHKWI
jgi:hypothetical protein